MTGISHPPTDGGHTLLHAYIDGWRRHDVTAVLETLTDDCVVIESYGPVYRGKARVEQWMDAWFGAGGTVDGWEITSSAASGDTLVVEWRFECTWKGERGTFDGCTVARLDRGRIGYLREYATTAELYSWAGAWRD